EAVAKLGTRALRSLDIPSLLDEAVHIITSTLDIEMSCARSLSPDGMLEVEAESGWGEQLVGARAPAVQHTFTAHVVHAREPVIVDDIQRDRRFTFPDIFREHHIRSVIAAPVPLPGAGARTYGLLSAHSRRQRAFGAEHVAFLQACAHVLGTAIELHTVSEERRRLLEHEQAAHAECDRLLAVFDTVLGAATVGIALVDTDMRCVRVNDALAALTGRPVQQHVGLTVH